MWRTDLKVETESEITAPQYQALKQNIMQKKKKKNYKNKQIANADYDKN
jgi:hypothetical protein